jgi:hypothetical protein
LWSSKSTINEDVLEDVMQQAKFNEQEIKAAQNDLFLKNKSKDEIHSQKLYDLDLKENNEAK